VGGLVGSGDVAVTNSYYSTTETGQSTSKGGTGKSNSEMKSQATYSGWIINEDGSVWITNYNRSYPALRWQTENVGEVEDFSKDLDWATIVFDKDKERPWTGSEVKPVPSVTMYDGEPAEGISITYANNIEVGWASLTIRGDGTNSTGSWAESFKIGSFAGGSGSLEDPFQISEAAHLQFINLNTDAGLYFKLTNDIDLTDYLAKGSDAGWNPLILNGHFDGAGHVVRGLWIKRPNTSNVGLFGSTGSGSTLLQLVWRWTRRSLACWETTM
jgi:hypothetical protein